MNKKIVKFCTGCGLCKSLMPGEVELINENGFVSFSPKTKNATSFCKKVCPCFGKQSTQYDSKTIWGRHIDVCFSYATNSLTRKNASSGGTITSIAVYLLSKQIVDGVIHLAKTQDCFKYRFICSTNSNEIIDECGSKYIDTQNLSDIEQLIEPSKRYVFIGKPCDVTILKNYSKISAKIKSGILYYLSFFCAGSPGTISHDKLFSDLCIDRRNVSSINYRGNGWPGKMVIKLNDGSCKELSYEQSWGKYLGRNVRRICRFCLDGVGEDADISCGDGWYVKDGRPDFSERNGRNVTFIRTPKGYEIFDLALKDGFLIRNDITDDYEEYLKIIQKYQFERRATMKSTILGLKIMGKTAPSYSKGTLKGYAKKITMPLKLRKTFGIISRVLKGRI